MRLPLATAAALVFLAVTACGPRPGARALSGPDDPPNVVFIISDDHGWPEYGFMGHPLVRTPNLDRLAAEGMLYTRGYTPTALCRPSLATLITGLYPHQHGITSNDPPGPVRDPAGRASVVELFEPNVTLPELLRERGYLSLQTGKWWEGDPTEHGFTRGMTHGNVARRGRHGDEGLTIGREGMQPIFDFIDSAGDRPFFVWYAPFLPHTPHDPPDRLLARYVEAGAEPGVAKYYAMVEWFDETVGELLDGLEARGLAGETLVLYASDNGWIQNPGGPSGVDARSKLSSYEAGVRTPIIAKWPGWIAPGRDERTLVSTLDFAPTVLNAVGIRPPVELPGIDLRDRAALARRDMLFGELFAHTAADVARPLANLIDLSVVREDGWKLILPYRPNVGRPMTIRLDVPAWKQTRPELYNVLEDPHETQDRAAERPELVAELREAIADWWPAADPR